MMLAFKSGEVKSIDTLKPLIQFQNKFKTLLKLLLVKVPGFANRNHKLDDNLIKRSEGLIYSENATVYQGVLEQFQSNSPDMLIVFKRERGFFVKLWEPDRIYKRDFYCTIPLLVLKIRIKNSNLSIRIFLLIIIFSSINFITYAQRYVSLNVDNDLYFGIDRYYSSGIFWSMVILINIQMTH